MSTFVQVVALILASIVTLGLGYLKVSITGYQQILIVIMVIALIFYNIYSSKSPNKKIPQFLVTPAIIFTSSFFIQLLVISTGVLFSPFLILFHLFALATSFLLSFQASLSFMVLAFITLGINVYLNPDEISQIKDDPGTVLLYAVSFLVVIPLAQIITKKYHIKDELSKILSHQVAVGESVMESLSEMVIITDANVKILSVNEAVKKMLGVNDSDVVNKNLFDIVNLKDNTEQPVTLESLSIDKVLAEHTTRIVSGFSLYIPHKVSPFKVKIQVRPIIDNLGKIEQLSFVITEGQNIDNLNTHQDLEPAFKNQKMRLQSLKEQLKASGLSNLNVQIELIGKAEQDILITEEIDDHGISDRSSMCDIAEITEEVVNSKLSLAQSLGVNLKFNMQEDDIKEASLLSLKKSSTQTNLLPLSDFDIPLDAKWIKILIAKIMDLAVLLAVSSKPPFVEVHLTRNSDSSLVSINIITSYPILENEQNFLFEKYYPKLQAKKILLYSSGLEGYIAKSILNQLNIPIIIRTYTNHTAFIISLAKKVR